MFNVTTLDRSTNETFIYQVDTDSERQAIAIIIASIQAGTKKGDTVYEVTPVNTLPSGPSVRAYDKYGELY